MGGMGDGFGGMCETAWVAAKAAWVEAWAVGVVHMLVVVVVVFPQRKKTAQAGIQLMYRRREIEKGLSAPRGAKEKRVKEWGRA